MCAVRRAKVVVGNLSVLALRRFIESFAVVLFNVVVTAFNGSAVLIVIFTVFVLAVLIRLNKVVQVAVKFSVLTVLKPVLTQGISDMRAVFGRRPILVKFFVENVSFLVIPVGVSGGGVA